MLIATGKSRNSVNWRNTEMDWPELKNRLLNPKRTEETVAEYKGFSVAEKSNAKDIGGFVGGVLTGPRRLVSAVKNRILITLDADTNASWDDWENFCALYGVQACVYTTHSHTPEAPRLRYIIPMSESVGPDAYQAVARKVAEWININSMDVTTYDVNRLMFWPSCPRDGEYLFKETPEDWPLLDPHDVLAEYGDDDAWKNAELWPLAETEQEAHVSDGRRQGEPTEKDGPVGLFCRVYSISSAIETFLPDVYEPAGEGRYTYLHGTTAAGAVSYDDTFLYSHHSTDPANDGHVHNSFDLVRLHKYGDLDTTVREGTPANSYPSYKALCNLMDTIPDIKSQLLRERAERNAITFGDLSQLDAIACGDLSQLDAVTAHDVEDVKDVTPDSQTPDSVRELSEENPEEIHPNQPEPELEPTPITVEGVIKGTLIPSCIPPVDATTDFRVKTPEREDWKDLLTINSRTKAVEPTASNLDLIFMYDEELKDKLYHDAFSYRPVLLAPVSWRRWRRVGKGAMNCMEWTDDDDAFLHGYIESAYGIDRKDKIDEAFKRVCSRHAIDPIVSYLNKITWDGVERLDTMFIRWLGAEDTKLNRAITRKWMCGAVKRALVPGCKFDQMLVLVGGQGQGKSRMADLLSHGWFSDSLTTMQGKEGYEGVQGSWIVEVSELSSYNKSTVEAVKQFVAARNDRFRDAYAHRVADHYRRCVFYGTTNTMGFLKDKTGERRFWPMKTKKINHGRLVGFELEVDQLWAEAKYRLEQGEELFLTGELEKELFGVQKEHTVEDDVVNLIEAHLDTPVPKDWFKWTDEKRYAWLRNEVDKEGVETGYVRTAITRSMLFDEIINCVNVRVYGSAEKLTYKLTDVLSNSGKWVRYNGSQRFGNKVTNPCYHRVGENKFPLRPIEKEEDQD